MPNLSDFNSLSGEFLNLIYAAASINSIRLLFLRHRRRRRLIIIISLFVFLGFEIAEIDSKGYFRFVVSVIITTTKREIKRAIILR